MRPSLTISLFALLAAATAASADNVLLTNLLFFGDDTSSASAQAGLGQVAVSTDTGYIPEPATLTLLSAGLLGLGSRLRRLRRAAQA